jgi:hypothetical protein
MSNKNFVGIVALEWLCTIKKHDNNYHCIFNYEFRNDDDKDNDVIKVKVDTMIVDKQKSIILLSSSSDNDELIKLALSDTQTEIVENMLNSYDDYFIDQLHALDDGGVAHYCESSCLNISLNML